VNVATIIDFVLLPFAAAYQGLTLLMVVTSAFEIRRLRPVSPQLLVDSALASGELPPVSILVPAYNEESTIARTVDSLLALRYPQLEVIVISDGSEDRTIDVLRERFGLARTRDESRRELMTQRVRRVFSNTAGRRVVVIDKRNGGKADALNAGIDYARFPLVLALDADVVLDPDALAHLAIPFALDARTVASSGMIRPQNGCDVVHGRLVRTAAPRTWLERVQVVEYMRAYGVGRMFFNRYNAQLIISGAFGLFSRQLLLDLTGYQTHAVGEDMELLVRAHRHLRNRGVPYRIGFAPDALCLTEAPHTLRDFGNQRTRWHLGLLSTLRLHRSMGGRSRYGAAGIVGFPYYVAELFYPFLELVGWAVLPILVLFGAVDAMAVLRFILVVMLLGSLVSLAALTIDSAFFGFFTSRADRCRLVVAALVEQAGFRQFTLFFRLRAFLRYYRTLQLRTGWRPPARAAMAPDARPDNEAV
jgi:cellulose synthase/poly-beta-1,6-N-acetylglucosamine synthase-like glycosyltransferase